MATRDADFPPNVRRLIAERAGYRCSVPFCNALTIGPGAAPEQSANVGTACHIYSASEGGARGTGGLTSEQRQSSENGIWCCATHGRLIDTNAGDRFPADLLLKWKSLHDARIHRELQGSTTRLGWVHRLEIVNSFLFAPSAVLDFSKATLIRGDGAVGKTAICEWLTGFQDNRCLDRWKDHEHDLKLTLFSPDPMVLQVSIGNHQIHRFRDGTRLAHPPRELAIVYLPEDYGRKYPRHGRDDDLDDLKWISEILHTDPEVIQDLCAEIRLNGHPFCRNMEFEEVHIDNEEEKIDGLFLRVDIGLREMNISFTALATSEQTAVLVQFAAALARLHARHTPTILVIDSAGWNWGEELFNWFASFLGGQPYQVILANAYRNLDLTKPDWAGWKLVEIRKGQAGRSEIIEKN